MADGAACGADAGAAGDGEALPALETGAAGPEGDPVPAAGAGLAPGPAVAVPDGAPVPAPEVAAAPAAAGPEDARAPAGTGPRVASPEGWIAEPAAAPASECPAGSARSGGAPASDTRRPEGDCAA